MGLSYLPFRSPAFLFLRRFGIERCQGRLASLQALVAEGSFSHSLFAAVDGEEAKLVDYSGKREKLDASLSEARSRATALEPRRLVSYYRSGDPEMRLKLKGGDSQKDFADRDLLRPGRIRGRLRRPIYLTACSAQ